MYVPIATVHAAGASHRAAVHRGGPRSANQLLATASNMPAAKKSAVAGS
jgi:hypothetical protein